VYQVGINKGITQCLLWRNVWKIVLMSD